MNTTDYTVRFWRNKLLGTWSYVITAPDGRKLYPVSGLFIERESAEKAALRSIKFDREVYEMTATELEEKYKDEQES